MFEGHDSIALQEKLRSKWERYVHHLPEGALRLSPVRLRKRCQGVQITKDRRQLDLEYRNMHFSHHPSVVSPLTSLDHPTHSTQKATEVLDNNVFV